MKAVVDSGVIAEAFLDAGEVGEWARHWIAPGEVIAPQLMLVEATNILRREESYGSISRSTASAAFSELLELKIELFPYHPFASRIWELRANVTAYDAWYVALAEFLDVPLVTVDSRLSRATGPRCAFELPPA